MMQIEISVYIWSIRTSLGMRTEICACALIVAKVTVKRLSKNFFTIYNDARQRKNKRFRAKPDFARHNCAKRSKP